MDRHIRRTYHIETDPYFIDDEGANDEGFDRYGRNATDDRINGQVDR